MPACRESGRFLARLLFPFVVAGCGGGGTAREPLDFWAMGAEAEVAEAMVAGFERANPGIDVRVQRLPWSAAHEKLLTAHVGASMPDVFQLGNTWIPEFALLGALEPLDARVDASASTPRGDFFEGALAPNVVDGALQALPWYVDTRLLFYRRDVLEAAGVQAPPRTWKEWGSAMRAVRPRGAGSEGGVPYGIFLPVDEWETPVILALQGGATLLREGDRFGDFRSDAVRRAFAFHLSVFASDLAPRRVQALGASVIREFVAGSFAFFVTGPWNLAELSRRVPADLDAAWATSPMPSPDGPGSNPASPGLSLAGGASLAVSSTSTRKDDAFRLLEYFASPTVQAEFRRRSGDLPSRRSAWDEPGLAGDARAAAFRAQLDHLASTPRVPEWERIAAKISLHLERMVRGDVDLDRGLADLDADVDAILEKRRWLLECGRLVAPEAPAASAPIASSHRVDVETRGDPAPAPAPAPAGADR